MQTASNIDPEILKILQEFVVHNPELEKLESLLDRFNIFEALGAIRQEVRHSDFLAFLLNPRQNHGLGDVFIKRLLQEAIAQADSTQVISPIELDLWDLGNIDVRREWQSIDIMILDDEHHFAVVIENKIYSGEHDDQLSRYRQVVQQHYPTFGIVGLFLTPDGSTASNPDFIPISYALICQLVEDIVRNRETTLGQDVLELMSHYAEMLRRYIVGESEIEKLCQQIYRKHQRALDLIYEYRPDLQAEIKEYLCELIESNPLLELDHSSKTYTFFIPKKWDLPILQRGQGWTRSGRILLFQFENRPEWLKLSLVLGPGPDYIRQRVFEIVSLNEPPFKRSFKALGKMWSTVYSRNILTKNFYVDKSPEEIQTEISRKFKEFLDHEFPKMEAILINEIANLSEEK